MTIMLAYFGPETSLPLVSTLTAVVGFALMMGRQSFSVLARGLRSSFRK